VLSNTQTVPASFIEKVFVQLRRFANEFFVFGKFHRNFEGGGIPPPYFFRSCRIIEIFIVLLVADFRRTWR